MDATIAKAERSPQIFPTPRDIRNAPTSRVALEVLQATQVGRVPSVDTVQTLLSRYAANTPRSYDAQLPRVPWPAAATVDPESQPEWMDPRDVHFYAPVVSFEHYRSELPDTRPPLVTTPRRDYYEIDDPNDALFRATLGAIEMLPDADKAEVVPWMVRLINAIPPDEFEDYLPRVLHFIEKSPRSADLLTPIMDYLYQYADDYTNGVFQDGEGLISRVYEIAWQVGTFHSELALRSLALRSNDTETRRLLGMIINERNYTDVINHVSTLIEANPDTPLAKKLERIGRMLLGQDPNDESIPFFTAAYELYRKHPLKDYHYLEKELPQDLKMIRLALAQTTGKGKVMEWGSGEGRVTKAAAKEMPKEEFIGIEILPEHVVEAKREDETGRVTYIVGDIKRTVLPDKSAKLIVSLGRTLMAFDERELATILAEVKRQRCPFLFSYGDPESPKYQRDVLYFFEILKGLQVAKYSRMSPEDAKKELDVVISSSDGKNWVHRYVFSREKLTRIFEGAGMKLTALETVPIPDLEGARSIYYLAEPMDESAG